MRFSSTYIETMPKKIEVGSPLWSFKHDAEELRVLEEGDPYTFSSQYQQEPSPLGGGMFKPKYWKYYEVLPPDIMMMRMYCDTAQKTKEHNDYSVFQVWGKSMSKGIFLIDQVRGKFEAPELESELVNFWNKHKPSLLKRMGVQLIKVEDKSSGSSLIQSIKKDYLIPIEDIQRNTDKVLRAFGVVKYFSSGFIHIPVGKDWLFDYTEEFRKFTPLMTHKFDDQIDPTMDAVEDLLINESALYNSQSLS